MLSEYHAKFKNQDNNSVITKQGVKKQEIQRVADVLGIAFDKDKLKVAVLGCADARYIPIHQSIFEEVFGLPVKMYTYDITIDHLEGCKNVKQHDCTLPLPDKDFDIILSHVLLKFIDKSKQVDVIKNSSESLSQNGVGIHIIDGDDANTTVEFDSIINYLKGSNLKYKVIKLKDIVGEGIAIVDSKNYDWGDL